MYGLGSLGRGGPTPLKITVAGAAITALLSSLTTGMLLLNQRTLEEVRFWLAGSVAHSDLSPDDACGGTFGLLLCGLAQQIGMPFPRGGAQTISDALASLLTALGGQIVTGEPARKTQAVAGTIQSTKSLVVCHA